MMREIRPVSELGRPAEHGRIRTGEKVQGKKGLEPRAIPNFRFTSPDISALTVLAAKYGGEPRPWDDPSAAVRDQWELYSEAAEIDVLLPPEALTVWYEQWTAAGCQRRCDGNVCSLPSSDPNSGDREEAPCLCAQQGVMVCSPKVRLAVALPGIEFRGVWRLDSSSWAAADEMSSIEPVLQQVQARGILRAKLVLERRSKMTGAGKRNFTVPKLVLAATLEELAAGNAGLIGIPVHTAPLQALGQANYQSATSSVQISSKVEEGGVYETTVPEQKPGDGQPGPATTKSLAGYASPSSTDDDIIDAHIVEDELTDPEAGLTYLEKQWEWALDVIEARCTLTRQEIVRGLCLSVSDGFAEKPKQLNEDGWGRVVGKAETLARSDWQITGVAEDGRLLVIRDGAA